jgi:DNA-binding NarL/FixJ family response regulator
LAEDHQLVREGLRALFSQEPALEIVGEASDGLGALELVEKSKPDVLLLDLRLPRLHGLEVLRQIPKRSNTKVLVLSMFSDDAYLLEALALGANGYVVKDCSFAELAQAIRAVASGEQYLSEPLRRKALSASLRWAAPGSPGRVKLSKRELGVLELAAEGKTSTEIATTLFISRRTAEAHRSNLMKKLGLKTQTDLVLYAVRRGLISA